MITRINITGNELGAVGIGPGDQNSGHVHDIGGQARGGQCANELRGRNQNLTAKMAALFFTSKLIFEMNGSGSSLDHRLHQLIRVQWPSKTSLRVSDDGSEPMLLGAALRVFDLISPLQGIVYALHEGGNTIGGIE